MVQAPRKNKKSRRDSVSAKKAWQPAASTGREMCRGQITRKHNKWKKAFGTMDNDSRLKQIIPEEKLQEPIAVFDSGMGGISVLRELVRVMPKEKFYYYGDSLNAPYGTKTKEEVRRLTSLHVRDFLRRGVKGVCIACNTATSAAVRSLREAYPQLPLVGIEPALKPATSFMDHPKVLVMATPMTIREEKFHQLLRKYGEEAQVYPLACPGLMEYVEEGKGGSEEVLVFLKEMLKDYAPGGKYGPMDAVVTGCTHYPFVADQIEEALGGGTRVFDGANGTAGDETETFCGRTVDSGNRAGGTAKGRRRA